MVRLLSPDAGQCKQATAPHQLSNQESKKKAYSLSFSSIKDPNTLRLAKKSSGTGPGVMLEVARAEALLIFSHMQGV